MIDPFILPLNETADSAVRAYVESIVSRVNTMDPTVICDVVYDDALNTDETQRAAECCIRTDLGMVIVFPNFKTDGAAAAILNRGLVQSMILEGFDDADLEKANVYGTLLEHTEYNVECFAKFLTTDLNMQAQKSL